MAVQGKRGSQNSSGLSRPPSGMRPQSGMNQQSVGGGGSRPSSSLVNKTVQPVVNKIKGKRGSSPLKEAPSDNRIKVSGAIEASIDPTD